MLLTLKILVWCLLTGVIYFLLKRGNRFQEQLNKANDDIARMRRNINSLHYNQSMLTSSVRKLYKELKRNDDNLKRQVRFETKEGS
jgi:hypothetical protein